MILETYCIAKYNINVYYEAHYVLGYMSVRREDSKHIRPQAFPVLRALKAIAIVLRNGSQLEDIH